MPAALRDAAAADPVWRTLEPAPRFAHDRLPTEEGMMGAFARMADAVDTTPMKLMRDFAGLSFGPGRVSFADYARLRLYDEGFWDGCDRRTVVGARRGRELMLQANYRHDWHAIAANKLAAGAYLSAYGLAVAPTTAIFARDLATPARNVLRTRDELREFLGDPAAYPLCGKPAEGAGGVHAFENLDAAAGQLRDASGLATPLDHLVDDICERYAAGYLFQPLLRPHRDVAALSGGPMGSVRLLTLCGEGGPKVARAWWKLPAAAGGGRSGPVLAQLDPRTGQILRATLGAGFDLIELGRHPDSKAQLFGAKVPDWQALKAAATEAARVMHGLGVIGWDMAPTDAGPVIVGLNPAPDLFAPQLADRQGALDAEFASFLAEQRHAGGEYSERVKADLARL